VKIFSCRNKIQLKNKLLFLNENEMKKIIIVFCLFFSFATKAQVFNGAGGVIQNLAHDTYFALSVSGLSPTQIDPTFGIEQVCININHPAVEELNVFLQSPSGNIVELTEGRSCSGINYTNTCFDSRLSASITSGVAPYTGSYKPIGYLGRFNTGQAGNGTWNLIVKDWLINANAGTLISWSITFGNSPSQPVVFSSSNLPIVIMNTTQPISDTKTLISLGIIDNGSPNRNNVTDPFNNYNQKAVITLHGSSTKDFEKKSYNFQASDMSSNSINVSILGMPSENDWELLAPYQDKSLIRIPLTYDLFRKMGHYASRFKNVEVVLNNEYQGIYLLAEKPKRDSNRISVNKLTTLPADNIFPNISGGYIIKIDRPDAPGWFSLFGGTCPTNTHFYYQYDYPKASDITIQQQNYIKSYVDSFETVMNSPSFADPLIGYSKYIHRGSFIDYFIINELSKNVDAYRFSTYMYKDRITHGGKLHIGPVWDYDIAWHNANYNNSFFSYGWQYQMQDTTYPSPKWWGRFMQDTGFVNALYCRWNELRQNILSINYLNNYIDSSASVLNESQQRNFTQWPVLGAYINPNPQNQTNATFLGEVSDLKTWIANRITWLDGAIVGHCSSTGGITKNNFDNNFNVYPNPMESTTTFYMRINEDADVSLCIVDLVGKEVNRYLKSHAPPGELKIIFEKKQIPAGIYFYQLQVNDAIKKGKIIIQ